MLELCPNCECCDRDLSADSADALICSFEMHVLSGLRDHRARGQVSELRRRIGHAPSTPGRKTREQSGFNGAGVQTPGPRAGKTGGSR